MRVSSLAIFSNCLVFTALSAACTTGPSEPALGTGSMSSNDTPVGISAVWAVPTYHEWDNGHGDYFDGYAVYFTTDRFTGTLHCSDRADLTTAYELVLNTAPGTPSDAQGLPELALGDMPVVAKFPESGPTTTVAQLSQFQDSFYQMSVGTVTVSGFDANTITGAVTAAGDDEVHILRLNGSFAAPICVH
jgi:hypothetical protein